MPNQCSIPNISQEKKWIWDGEDAARGIRHTAIHEGACVFEQLLKRVFNEIWARHFMDLLTKIYQNLIILKFDINLNVKLYFVQI